MVNFGAVISAIIYFAIAVPYRAYQVRLGTTVPFCGAALAAD